MARDDRRGRIITGTILAAVFVALLIAAEQSHTVRVAFSWLLGLAIAIAAWEAARLVAEGLQDRLIAVLLFVLPFLGVLVDSTWRSPSAEVTTARMFAESCSWGVLSFFALLSLIFARSRNDCAATPGYFLDWGSALLHVGLGGGCVVALSQVGGSTQTLAWLVLVVALGDTAAYFVGASVGGPKLAPAISPKKTISGSLAGLAASALAGGLGGAVLLMPNSLGSMALMGLVVGAAEQLGDLNKSLLKRRKGVKDSGTILPGHGGAYDRLDGILSGAIALAAISVLFC